jgi:hypothetical protein
VVKAFEAKKINPEAYTLYSYAAVQLIKLGAEKAKSLDPKKVAEAIHSGDTFDTDRGHVVAALVRKALLAVERGQSTFEVWGDGSATRDFVYVGDVAEGIATIALEARPFAGESFNLGSGRETSIGEIAEAVAHAAGPGLRPRFLADKPVGYTRRVMSVERAAEKVGYRAATTLADGLARTVDWLRSTGRVVAWLEDERKTPTVPLAPRRDPVGDETSSTRAA